MGRSDGQLDPLTIAGIFIVVLALMYVGIGLWEGTLLPDDRTSDEEDRLREAVWDELDVYRASQGLDPMPLDRFEQGHAQDTAAFVSRDWPGNDSVDGVVLDGTTKPNRKLFCTRLVVRVPTSETGASNGTGTNDVPTDATATRVARALVAVDEQGVLHRRPARFHAALGVVVRADTVYAVYRSCELVDI